MFDSTEWLRSDPRRTAVGLDLDLEALNWCLENNINELGTDGYSRIYLFQGNVLQPLEARVVKYESRDLIGNMTLKEDGDSSGRVPLPLNSTEQGRARYSMCYQLQLLLSP